MNPVLISNQSIFESIQAPTLSNEPQAKSTILYANRFSGVGNPVEVTDPELKGILDSSIGTAGNNILVQLKQKMSAFRNGPWYIDSLDGVVYIHNRKYTDKAVTNYTYQNENGELLSASFRMVEVRKPLSGLGGFISAVDKAVKMVSAKVDALADLGTLEPPTASTNTSSTSKNSTSKKPMTNSKLTRDGGRSILIKDIQRADRALTNAKDARTRAREVRERKEKAYKSTPPESIVKVIQSKHPVAYAAWQDYLKLVKQYGSEDKITKAAYDNFIKTFGKIQLPAQDTDTFTDYFYTKFYIKVRCRVSDPPTEQYLEEEKAKQLKAFLEGRGKASYAQGATWVSATPWKLVSSTKAGSPSSDTNTYGNHMQTYMSVATLKWLGQSKVRTTVSLSRFLGDYSILYRKDSPQGDISKNLSGFNPGSIIQNAASNIGKYKTEKKLQATIRVIGNPILESAQQIYLYNVGKKHSGLWYIVTVTHTLEHGQGYICDLELSRQLPKASSSGESTEVHTQSATVDNEEANPTSTSYKGRVNHTSVKSTSSTGRSKANVVSTNKEYTYQDAANEPWKFEERVWVQQRLETARTPDEARAILTEETYNIADKNYINHTHGTNKQYAVAVNKGGGNIAARRTVIVETRNGRKIAQKRVPINSENASREYKNWYNKHRNNTNK